MEKKEKLKVLARIAAEFNRVGITWAVGASVLLYFKEIVDEFHDLDLMVTLEDADRAKSILQAMGTLMPANPNEKYETKVFLEFVIDGVDVDLMAGFAIVHEGQVHDCSLAQEQIAEEYILLGERIPLQSVELWCQYYELMGRTAKVEMIQAVLAAEKNS